MLRAVASLLAPPLCGVCGSACPPGSALCERCAAALERVPPARFVLPSGLEVMSAAPYAGVARELVVRLKFSARLALAEPAAARMAAVADVAEAAVIVPVPPAPVRARARGFDAAGALAHALSRATGARLAHCLARRDGPRQVGRPRRERLADGPRVQLARGVGAPPAEALVVDDVCTTGATLSACAACLPEGARALTFARAESGFGPDVPEA